jgi:hypothetical protein
MPSASLYDPAEIEIRSFGWALGSAPVLMVLNDAIVLNGSVNVPVPGPVTELSMNHTMSETVTVTVASSVVPLPAV